MTKNFPYWIVHLDFVLKLLSLSSFALSNSSCILLVSFSSSPPKHVPSSFTLFEEFIFWSLGELSGCIWFVSRLFLSLFCMFRNFRIFLKLNTLEHDIFSLKGMHSNYWMIRKIFFRAFYIMLQINHKLYRILFKTNTFLMVLINSFSLSYQRPW